MVQGTDAQKKHQSNQRAENALSQRCMRFVDCQQGWRALQKASVALLVELEACMTTETYSIAYSASRPSYLISWRGRTATDSLTPFYLPIERKAWRWASSWQKKSMPCA